jgi:hypothetical protein
LIVDLPTNNGATALIFTSAQILGCLTYAVLTDWIQSLAAAVHSVETNTLTVFHNACQCDGSASGDFSAVFTSAKELPSTWMWARAIEITTSLDLSLRPTFG